MLEDAGSIPASSTTTTRQPWHVPGTPGSRALLVLGIFPCLAVQAQYGSSVPTLGRLGFAEVATVHTLE